MKPLMIRPCPECGGQRVPVEYYDGTIFLKQGARSTSFFKQKSNISSTRVLVCLCCGYTAWYAVEPANLIPDE